MNIGNIYNTEEENVLEKYGRDITKQAKLGKIDPVIGRDEEIRSITRILSRKTKNNPVLIGEAGVGKTAIAEGLAQRIIKGDVPDSLKNKTVWELDLTSLVAGAKFKGEYEERLKAVLKKIEESDGSIIMFIDEIHMIVSNNSDSSMDTSNMLKPLLARGMIKVIGATTLNEYRKYIEKDGALERRFQKIMVNEPNVTDTITILRGLKQRLEVYHGVTIKDKALIAAANLSNRYITDRFLPDKAIDLVDEACATIKVQMDFVPEDLDKLERKIMRLEIELEAIKKDKDEESKKRALELKDKISILKKERDIKKNEWQEEKNKKDMINLKKEELEKAKFNLEQAENNYDLELAAKLRHGDIPKLESELEELYKNDTSKILSLVVDEEDICEIVSKLTRIPVSKLAGSEKEKLINLKDNMKEKVKGQDEALELVSDAIIRARAGIKDPTKPIGSFIFLGPTGVGKTEVAKTLAELLFESERNMVRIDMSEYMESHSVSRLIGAPPGYVGYDEGGMLTEKVRRNPYSIVLFDEVEKAHKDVLNVLLQILDDGRITDGQGRCVDFKNTIIIMTSNLGSEYVLKDDKEKVMMEVKDYFKPEFLNRIDEVIIFNSLTKDTVYLILDKIINELKDRLSEHKLDIVLTNKCKEYIISSSYDEAFGARPIKRFVTKNIETLIAKGIISGLVKDGMSITIDYDKELILK